MTSLICNAPFCENPRNYNHAWCPIHRWEREKFKVKSFKQILLFKELKPKNKPKYTSIKQKQYNEKYSEKRKEWRLKKRYNITLEEYESLLIKQQFKCAICGVKSNKENWQNDKTQRFDVDHCHKTGNIRGLLCRRCNIFIGYIDKDTHLLDNIKAYIT